LPLAKAITETVGGDDEENTPVGFSVFVDAKAWLFLIKAARPQVSESVFDVFSFQPELAAIVAGLVGSGFLGVVYLWIPSIIVCRRYRAAVKRSLKPLAAILGGAIIALAASELLGNSFLAASSSVALVLANMSLFAALPGIFPDVHSRVLGMKRSL